MVDLSPVAVLGVDHVQLAAPRGCEEAARSFYGGLLGMSELPKPEPLRSLAAASGSPPATQELHVGVEEPFAPARKAHPGLVVDDLDAVRARLAAAGHEPEDDTKIEGVRRLFVHDPFGNRLEVRQG